MTGAPISEEIGPVSGGRARAASHALVAACASATLSCTELVRTLVIAPPDLGTAKSVALVLDRPDSPMTLIAAAGGEPVSFLLEREHVEGARIEALLYDDPLEMLGLVPGEHRPAMGPPSHLLPPPRASFAREVTAARWAPVTAQESRALSEFQLAGEPALRCPEIETEHTTLDAGGDTAFTIELDEDAALLGTDDGKVFRVFAAGGPSERPGILPLVVAPATSLALAAARTATGTLYLGGPAGEIWEGKISGSRLELQPIGTSSSGERVRAISAGPGPDGALEVFTVGAGGSFERFSGGRWRRLYRFPFHPDVVGRASIVRLGPGEVLAGQDFTNVIARSHGDRPPDLIEPDGLTTTVASIEEVPGVGIFVTGLGGTTGSEILRFEPSDGTWTVLPGFQYTLTVHTLSSFGPGFLYAGSIGEVGVWVPRLGFCEMGKLASSHAFVSASLGGDQVVIGVERPRSQDRTPVTFIRRKAESS